MSTQSLKEGDQRLVDSQNLLAYYKETFSSKKPEPAVADTPAQKKSKKEEQKVQQQMVEQQAYLMSLGGVNSENAERAMLLRKLQQAKWNARLGHR